MRRVVGALAGLLLVGVPPGEAAAQEAARATVVVRQVAGSSVYLDVGTRHGLASGDTISVYREGADAPVGRMTVAAATETRSVLAFAGPPFPVTRGESLILGLLRPPAEEPPPPPARDPAARAGAPTGREAPTSRSTRPRGRIGFDLSATHSTTLVGSVDPEEVGRTFATPAFRFDVTAPGAVGGFTLRTGGRLAYRYSETDVISPAASARIYALSLERDVPGSRVRLALGRFHSPVESYSGFWDGGMIRVGSPGFGVGALVGFEPERWNEKPSTSRPKATAFTDWMRRGRGWRWQGSVSAHAVRPTDSLPDHTFLGVGQRVSAGRFRLSQDLQVDRDPVDGVWKVSRASVRGAAGLGRHLEVRAGFARRESWLFGGLGLFAPRSDRVDGGLAIRGSGGSMTFDLSRSSDATGRESTGATGSVRVAALPGTSTAGASGVVSRWSGPYGTTLSGSPSLDFDLSPVWLRVGYRFYRSDFLERVSTTHGAEASLDVPFGSGLRLTARARAQWGSWLRSQSVDLGVYRIF